MIKRFSDMTCEELVSPGGYACSCGRHHACPMSWLRIGPGAVETVPEMLAALGAKKPFLVFDKNTRLAAGNRVIAILEKNGIPYSFHMLPGERPAPAEWEVGSVVMHFDRSCDLILAVGSGVINDICKVAARHAGLPSAVVGTAPSMDGYASNSSSMEVDHVKVTLYNRAPAGIILDTDILKEAPMRMLWAGLGDMAAKYIALCEWRISHIATGEYYCEEIADMMRAAVDKVVKAAAGIPSRDPEAVQSIAEGLITAGVAMAYAGISRPASGLEHYFSHMWEMMALERGKPYDLHGIQVGVGTVLCLKLYRSIVHITPDRERAIRQARSLRPEEWEAQVRRIFGKTAEEILRIERETKKNDPSKHEKRLEALTGHWDEILGIIRRELPDADALIGLMASAGMPLMPADIGISDGDTLDAFLGSRDVRDKYITSSMLWDLGLTEEYTERLQNLLEEQKV